MKITTNVFSNTCIGGYMMRLQGAGNNNPLVWTIIPDFESVAYLMSNFDDIDWLNYTISASYDSNRSYPVYTMKIDNHIRVRFVHIIEDKNCNTPVKSGEGITDVDVRIDNVPEYLEDCYLRRVERMLNNNIEPTFVFSQDYLSETEIQALEAIKTPYTKLFVLKQPLKDITLEKYVVAQGNEYEKAERIMQCYNNRLKRANKPVLKPVEHVNPVNNTKYRIKEVNASKTPKKNLPTIMSGSKVAKLLYT